MSALLRIITGTVIFWAILYFFYSLGKRKAREELNRTNKKQRKRSGPRKYVESSVINDEDSKSNES